MLSRKECIWLGIRVIGFTWLFRLLQVLIEWIWSTGYWLWVAITGTAESSFPGSYLVRLTMVPYPLFFTVYFLFFGTFVYKLIDRCTASRLQDPARPPGYGYCEIIIRFFGIWVFFMAVGRLYAIALTYVNQVLYLAFTPSQRGQSNILAAVSRHYFNGKALVSLALYLGLTFFLAWYFLKKGGFFINLLHRLWLEKPQSKPVMDTGSDI